MRLSEEDVGQLNIVEYAELIKRKQVEDDKLRLNAGFVYAAILNSAWGDPNRRPAQPTDIVASMHKPEEFDLRLLDPDAQVEYMTKVFAGHMEKKKPGVIKKREKRG